MSGDIARLNDTQIAAAIRRQLTDVESARHRHIMSCRYCVVLRSAVSI